MFCLVFLWRDCSIKSTALPIPLRVESRRGILADSREIRADSGDLKDKWAVEILAQILLGDFGNLGVVVIFAV